MQPALGFDGASNWRIDADEMRTKFYSICFLFVRASAIDFPNVSLIRVDPFLHFFLK